MKWRLLDGFVMMLGNLYPGAGIKGQSCMRTWVQIKVTVDHCCEHELLPGIMVPTDCHNKPQAYRRPIRGWPSARVELKSSITRDSTTDRQTNLSHHFILAAERHAWEKATGKSQLLLIENKTDSSHHFSQSPWKLTDHLFDTSVNCNKISKILKIRLSVFCRQECLKIAESIRNSRRNRANFANWTLNLNQCKERGRWSRWLQSRQK